MRKHAAFAAVLTVLFTLSFPGSAAASERMYLTSGISRARAFAMGSAYSSLEDDFSAGLYNPAAFRLNATRSERRFRLILNPIGSAAAFSEYATYDLDYHKDRRLTGVEAALAAVMLLKGATFTTSAFDVGFMFNEPVIRGDSSAVSDGRFFTVEGVTREAFHGAFLNLKIAPTVSLGLTGSLYQRRNGGRNEYSGGYTFGVLLDPTNWMKVGFSYHQIPDNRSDTRTNLESIETGAVSGGVSYYPDSQTTFSMDVRNLNKEAATASLEIHAGAERVIGNRLALRAGYFRKKGTEHDVVSFGAGILPIWVKLQKYRHSTRHDLLSYTFVMEEGDRNRRWHIVSLLFTY